MRKLDLSNSKFGRLTVINVAPSLVMGKKPRKRTRWNCSCECGNFTIVRTEDLMSGNTLSCGCLHKDTIIEICAKHGLTNTQEWNIWNDIRRRCYDTKRKCYHNYGGRGITMCDEWRDNFLNFYLDMGKRPSKFHSIDRIENDKGYSKENCRWATAGEQMRNVRYNRWLEYDGKRMILTDWAIYFKVNHSTLIEHLQKKTFEQVFTFYKQRDLAIAI